MKQKSEKHSKFPLFLIAILFIWWFNNFTVKVTDICFTDERINDVISIVQISDLHGAVFGKDNRRLIDKIEAQNPDLIFVTGDMYTNLSGNNGQETALKLLQYLGKHYEVYYVNGEHDNDNFEFFNALESSGVHVFNYKDEIITVKNTKLHLYGINNVYYTDTFDLHNAFESDNENYSILLAHSSNFAKFREFGADLSICGDTHGGMFRLPVIGAVYDGSTLLPEQQGIYIKGEYTVDGSTLFISSGLGSYPAPVRFLNRPEVVSIKLAPQN